MVFLKISPGVTLTDNKKVTTQSMFLCTCTILITPKYTGVHKVYVSVPYTHIMVEIQSSSLHTNAVRKPPETRGILYSQWKHTLLSATINNVRFIDVIISVI